MRVTANADQEDRPGGNEWMRGLAPTLQPDPAPAVTWERPTDAAQASQRARRRARRRQAISRRRRPFFRWTDDATRVTAGLTLLVLLALIVSTEGWRDGSRQREASQAVAVSREVPTAQPSLTAPEPVVVDAPETVPTGPIVSQQLIEANGPIDGCTFLPSLATLRVKLGPVLVGDCVEDPLEAADVDPTQRTTNGVLSWRRADARVAFTDGTDTWLDGPKGIVRRRNNERYAWEPDEAAGPRPPKTRLVLPPPLPGAVLPARRIVSFYGNPLSPTMGILGELTPEQLFPRLRTQAAAYAAADSSRPVTPALELVAVVAQSEPGPDGLYRLRMEPELIEKVAGWAEQNDCLLILDVQVGRGNVDAEIQWLMPFLKRPNVHLALDPEFAMPSGQVPGQRIGTMDAAAVNGAVQSIAELVATDHLPPKVLIVHRFTEEMVTNTQAIVTDPRVQVIVVMDGFGAPSVKMRQYDELIVDQRVEHTGIKLFFHHDEPLLTPAQILQLDPAPDLVIYQ
jgi:hypothetical protein